MNESLSRHIKQALEIIFGERGQPSVAHPFSAEHGLVIGQLACEEKSNEITAIPKLLEMLEIKGCIVTIDAMGTQTEIAKAIRDKEGDYILALKESQKTLYNDVKLYLDDVRQEKKLLESENYYKTVEKMEFLCKVIGRKFFSIIKSTYLIYHFYPLTKAKQEQRSHYNFFWHKNHGSDNSIVWRLYFYFQGEKYRCTGRNFFNWFPAVL